MELQKNYLVVGNDENSNLIRSLQRKKITPYIRRKSLSAINLVRHQKMEAIIIDAQYKEIDPIELVLNVRDLDLHVPVFIYAEELIKTYREALEKLKNVRIIRDISEIS